MLFFGEKDSFIAIIGDIRNSKELESRKVIQDKLKLVLADINKKYQKDIAAKFLITLGDEFQGLLSDTKNVLQIIEEIKMRLYPVEIRFGIGIGKITTDINTEMALGADGPGYHKARNAIEILKEHEKRNKAVASDIRLEAEDSDVAYVVLINTVFELLKAIEENWTNRQREIIWNMQKYQDGQRKASERLGIAQSSVNKALSSGKYYAYVKALKDVESILGELKI